MHLRELLERIVILNDTSKEAKDSVQNLLERGVLLDKKSSQIACAATSQIFSPQQGCLSVEQYLLAGGDITQMKWFNGGHACTVQRFMEIKLAAGGYDSHGIVPKGVQDLIPTDDSPVPTLKLSCCKFVRSHLMEMNEGSNLFYLVKTLDLPPMLAKLLLYFVSL